MTSLEPKSGNKERMGADVDVGLWWDVKGDFILSFYFFCQVGGKVCWERERGGEKLEGRRMIKSQEATCPRIP